MGVKALNGFNFLTLRMLFDIDSIDNRHEERKFGIRLKEPFFYSSPLSRIS